MVKELKIPCSSSSGSAIAALSPDQLPLIASISFLTPIVRFTISATICVLAFNCLRNACIVTFADRIIWLKNYLENKEK